MDYIDFLKSKVDIAKDTGFDISPDEVNPIMKPHARDAVIWAIHGGRRALFESFGLHKTTQQLEIARLIIKHKGGKGLIVVPLGVKHEFVHDASVLLDMEEPQYVRTMEEVKACSTDIMLTNYERVRDGDIDPLYFTVCSLDEAAILRSGGNKTYFTFLKKFDGVPFKFVATATPSPNDYIELMHYSQFLEILDVNQVKTRFFKRDSAKADHLTLYQHKEKDFWLWVSSWALFIDKPSDLGHSDEGYDLPALDIRYHVIQIDHSTIDIDKSGQLKLIYENAAFYTSGCNERET